MVEQHGMNFVYMHSILIKILLLDYLHEFFAESKLMDKSCFLFKRILSALQCEEVLVRGRRIRHSAQGYSESRLHTTMYVKYTGIHPLTPFYILVTFSTF